MKQYKHKHYEIGEMGKYEIGKYKKSKNGTSENLHLTKFKKSC